MYMQCINSMTCVSTATYDIHNFTAIGNGGRITVTGKFINNTFATGCFIVIQNNSRATDTYRALLLPDSEQTVSEVISVPPSIYTVYAYDLEVNALPNPLPAVTSGSPINIKSKCEYSCYTHTHNIHASSCSLLLQMPCMNFLLSF